MKNILLLWLQQVAKDKILFNIQIYSGVIRTYDDSTGQRSCYLEHYGYGAPNPTSYPEIFKVKRHCDFVNNSDEGKQGAVLFTLNITDIQGKDIQISESCAKFNGIEIHTRKNVEICA